MTNTTEQLFECEECEELVPYSRIMSVETHRATRYEPADGFNVCEECFQAMQDADEARFLDAAEAKAEAAWERELDGW